MIIVILPILFVLQVVHSTTTPNWDGIFISDKLNDHNFTICFTGITAGVDVGLAFLRYSSYFEVDSPEPHKGEYVMAMQYPNSEILYSPLAPRIIARIARRECTGDICEKDICLDYDISPFQESPYLDQEVFPTGSTRTETYTAEFTASQFLVGDVAEYENKVPKKVKQISSKVFDIEVSEEVNILVLDNNDYISTQDAPYKEVHVELHPDDSCMVGVNDASGNMYMTSFWISFVDYEFKAVMRPTVAGLAEYEANNVLDGSCEMRIEIENPAFGTTLIYNDLDYHYSKYQGNEYIVPSTIIPELYLQLCDANNVCIAKNHYFGEQDVFPNAVYLATGLTDPLPVVFKSVRVNATIENEDGTKTSELLSLTSTPIVNTNPLTVLVQFDDTWWLEKNVRKAQWILMRGYIELDNARRQGELGGVMEIQTELVKAPADNLPGDSDEDKGRMMADVSGLLGLSVLL